MFKIYLSPSTQEHNIGNDDYGTEEIRMNEVADVTAKELTRAGQFTIYRNNPAMSINQVVADSDTIKPQIHVAIHSNAFNSKARGVLGLYWSGGGTNSNSYKLTKAIHDEVLAISGHNNGIRAGTGLAETDRVKATSTIIEVGFHDNADDAQWIKDNIKPIGIAIAKGVCKYFNVQYVPEPVIGNGNKECIGTGIVNTNTLNLRSVPNADSTILGQFVAGDKLWFYENNNGWLRVYPDKTGWVSEKFINIDKPVVIKPVVPIPVIPVPPLTPIPAQMYRVRKSWEDAKGQIAAYKDLTNAKERADSSVGYKVFDKDGNIVYTPIIPIPIPDPIPEVIVVPEVIVDADIKNILTKLLDMIKTLLGQKK